MRRLLLLTLLAGSLAAQTRFDASSQLSLQVANDGTTGTTLNQLAKANSSGNAINAGTTDTGIPVFVVVGGAGTTGNAQLAVAGAVICKFDASGGTAGHYVQASTATAGRCLDAGATVPTSGWIVGTLLSSPAANATGTVLLVQGFLPSAGGGGGVSSVSGTANQIASTGGSTPVLSIANPFTFPGEGTFAASTAGAASGNIPSGPAVTTPIAGDFWRDSGGFEFFDATSTNGAVDVVSTNAGAVGPAGSVRYTADSNVAKVSENGGALQEVVQLTKTQAIQNKTLDSTDTGIWQPLGCSVTGGATGCTTASTSTISVTATTARKHYIVRLIITGYSGGGGIARAQLGNTSTPDTGTNYAFGGFNLASGTSTAPTVTGVGSGSTAQSGCPVSGSATTVGRFVQMNVSNPGAAIKYFTIETSGIGASAAVTPNLAHIACTWNNTTSGIGTIQFQACTTINGACTTVNFNSGTSLTVWGRDDN
ncbi:MAG: hypothetical protein ACJ71W_22095 [Terriglobales bacterium]